MSTIKQEFANITATPFRCHEEGGFRRWEQRRYTLQSGISVTVEDRCGYLSGEAVLASEYVQEGRWRPGPGALFTGAPVEAETRGLRCIESPWPTATEQIAARAELFAQLREGFAALGVEWHRVRVVVGGMEVFEPSAAYNKAALARLAG